MEFRIKDGTGTVVHTEKRRTWQSARHAALNWLTPEMLAAGYTYETEWVAKS